MLGQARKMEVFRAHEQHSKMVISGPILTCNQEINAFFKLN